VGSLTPDQISHFRDEGYLVVEDLLDPARDLDPIIAGYATVLDRLADDLHAAGSIASTYAELPFSERLTRIYAESGKVCA
jgi:phytanoyl-CoA hydroxylase